jgi:hypothetical protein
MRSITTSPNVRNMSPKSIVAVLNNNDLDKPAGSSGDTIGYRNKHDTKATPNVRATTTHINHW